MNQRERMAAVNLAKKTRQTLEKLTSKRIMDKAAALTICGFLDVSFYLANYPDVEWADIDPGLHYLLFGFREARQPGGWCDKNTIDGLHRALPAIGCIEFEIFLQELIKKLAEK